MLLRLNASMFVDDSQVLMIFRRDSAHAEVHIKPGFVLGQVQEIDGETFDRISTQLKSRYEPVF